MASAHQALAAFAPRFEAVYLGGLRRKIGLSTEHEGDAELAQDLLLRMAENGADFTLAFRRLCGAAGAGAEGDAAVRVLFSEPGAYDAWAGRWRERLADALRPDGAWYMSFKLGGGERVSAEGRLFVDHTEETLARALAGVAVDVAVHWVTTGVQPGRSAERWVNAVAIRR